MRVPHRVRQFFAKVLKKIQHYRVDVVAGNTNAAAYKYYERQEYQDLYNSSVAAMLREMQREANMNRPFQSRLRFDYSTMFDSCSKQYFNRCTTTGSTSLLELPTRQHANTTKSRSTKICTFFFSVAVMLREMQRKVNAGRRYERRLHLLIITPITIFLSSAQQVILIVAWWLFSHGENPPGPRIVRKLGSNTRERSQNNEKRQDEDSPFSKGIEILLSEIAGKVYPDPEKVKNPTVAPQDYEVRQSGRVLELQNRDFLDTTSRACFGPFPFS